METKEPLINSESFSCAGKMRQFKALIAGNSTAIAKIGNAKLAHFTRQMLIHELIRGSLDDTAGIRRYLVDHKTELRMQRDSLDELNREYFELKTKNLEAHAREKIQQFLDKSMARLFRSCTVFVAKAACKTELSESGRRSRINQLGFEGGSADFDGLSGRQIATALIAILVTFLTISVVQELSKEPQFRKFGNVSFMTFLMFFTYGSALIIALNLKRQLTMGYNELTRQRSWFAYLVTVAALGFASMIAYFWMEGLGWFEGYATREETYRIKSPLSVEWLVFKGAAIGAVVGWLVPMWFYINRSKAPDQIAGRLISMNKRGLSEEIRNLKPNELIKAVAAVSASVAAIDHDISRNEHDVYQIICSHLAGLPNSDVDIDGATKEFGICLQLIESNELKLESRLKIFQRLPLLSSLMPYIASSIAFADGVYLEEEHAIVVPVKNHVTA
jgi:tellurite resistance protein